MRKMPKNQSFTETVGSVAAEVRLRSGLACSEATVRLAAERGIVPSIRDAAGRRLLPRDAAQTLVEHRKRSGFFVARSSR
jgi:hypothetical protein